MNKDYKIIKFTQAEIPNYIECGIKNSPCVLYGIHDKPFVWICKEEKCNYEYIQKNKIAHIKINGGGSTIVCSSGDIDFGFFGDKEFCLEMFEKISQLVSQKVSGNKLLNNDFMYNNCKYGSMTSIDLGNCFYVGVHISNNIDNDLITNICQKKCYKTPSKLENQITERDVVELFGGV